MTSAQASEQVVLFQAAEITDRDLNVWHCDAHIMKSDFCCDIYIELRKVLSATSGELVDLEKYTEEFQGGVVLCEDPVFLAGIHTHLQKLGYKGALLGRAEMGMQSEREVVLETGPAFQELALSLGWVYEGGMNEYREGQARRAFSESFPHNVRLKMALPSGERYEAPLYAVLLAYEHGLKAEFPDFEQRMAVWTKPSLQGNLPALAEWVTSRHARAFELLKPYLSLVKEADEDPRAKALAAGAFTLSA